MIYQDRLGTTNVKENSKEDFAHRSRRIRWLALAVAFCVSSQTIKPWIPTKRQRLSVFLDSLSFTFEIDNKRLRWLVVALTDDIKSGAQGWIRELHNGDVAVALHNGGGNCTTPTWDKPVPPRCSGSDSLTITVDSQMIVSQVDTPHTRNLLPYTT
jgi:hypothetical protein